MPVAADPIFQFFGLMGLYLLFVWLTLKFIQWWG